MTAPNTDLADIRQKWLKFCAHDTGLPYPCICPDEDHRPVIAALVGEVETLRAEVARLTKGRDEARGERDTYRSVVEMQEGCIDAVWPVVHAAKAWRRKRYGPAPVPPMHEQFFSALELTLIAAVDQMATPTALSASVAAQNGEVVAQEPTEVQRRPDAGRLCRVCAHPLGEDRHESCGRPTSDSGRYSSDPVGTADVDPMATPTAPSGPRHQAIPPGLHPSMPRCGWCLVVLNAETLPVPCPVGPPDWKELSRHVGC